MFCNSCGKPIPDDVRSCSYCGKAVALPPAAPSVAPPRQLVRPLHGRRIAGVCAGVAQHFGWNPTVVRLLWFLFFFFGGGGLLAYVIMWIVMPNEPYHPPLPVPVQRS